MVIFNQDTNITVKWFTEAKGPSKNYLHKNNNKLKEKKKQQIEKCNIYIKRTRIKKTKNISPIVRILNAQKFARWKLVNAIQLDVFNVNGIKFFFKTSQNATETALAIAVC